MDYLYRQTGQPLQDMSPVDPECAISSQQLEEVPGVSDDGDGIEDEGFVDLDGDFTIARDQLQLEVVSSNVP